MTEFRVKVTVSFDAWVTVRAKDADEAEYAAEDFIGDSKELFGDYFDDADEKAVYAHRDEIEEVGGEIEE